MSIPHKAVSPEGFHTAVVEGRSDDAVQIIQALYFSGWTANEVFDGPVHETLVRIGNEFPQSDQAIFKEHQATSICTRALMLLRSLMPSSEADAPKAICAAPTGDPYLIPSLMCSIVLHDIGFAEIDLGPNTPLDIVCDAICFQSPRIVSISVTSAFRSRAETLSLEKLHRFAIENECTLIVGGQNANLINIPGLIHGRSMTELHKIAQPIFKRS